MNTENRHTRLEPTPANSNGWLALVACPDCADALKVRQTGLFCETCDRSFARIGRAVDLLPAGVQPLTVKPEKATGLRRTVVKRLYTQHRTSPSIERGLQTIDAHLDSAPNSWGLNIGCRSATRHPRLLNLDLGANEHVDVLGVAERLPFQGNSLRAVVSQEVFEHLPDPDAAAREVARVLEPGGLFYLQVPFVIGFHGAPSDFWRFTAPGLCELVARAGLEVHEVAPSLGAGTSMYRISVEFFAALAGALHRKLYLPAKGMAAVLCYPFCWADALTRRESPTNRIPAGYYVIAGKRGGAS